MGKLTLPAPRKSSRRHWGVLRRKFGWPDGRLEGARATIEASARIVEPSQELNVIAEDPPDNRIIECAVEGGSAFIVSEDKDFLRRGSYEGIQMVNVAEFLNTLRGQQP